MRDKVKNTWMFLLGSFGIPIIGIILLLLPWKKIKRSMHYPLGPDGIEKKAKDHASNTIIMNYMAQEPTREGETLDLTRRKRVD